MLITYFNHSTFILFFEGIFGSNLKYLKMATKHRILCINKSDRQNHYERITRIGGKNVDGSKWKITEDKAIEGIENGIWAFYVGEGANAVDVIISTSSSGHKYLKTKNDGKEPNNLLSLPECV